MKPTLAAAAAALSLAIGVFGAAAPAQAALVDRGGGLVYDTERDLTWLTAPALLPGVALNWLDAAEFASDFVFAGGANWLLPQTPFADAGCAGAEGFGCIGSQMGHLFHERLGGQPGESVFDTTGDSADDVAAVALFPALQSAWFWSWQLADDGANTAFAFHFGTGEQAIRDTTLSGRVLLVHNGDLGAASAVDSPPTLPLVLAALLAGFVARPRWRRGG